MTRHAMWFVLAATLLSSPLSAQSKDHDDIMNVIRIMFDGLKELDTAKMRSTMHPGTRFILTSTQNGVPTVRDIPGNIFLANIASSQGTALEERYWNPRVVIHDNLASVWIDYAFYVNGNRTHCGEDNFQLARWADGWKIVAVGDTQRQECGP